MNQVPIELIQAAADALLRFPGLPDDVRAQFVGYLSGAWVDPSKLMKQKILMTHKNNKPASYIPWIYLMDITQEMQTIDTPTEELIAHCIRYYTTYTQQS